MFVGSGGFAVTGNRAKKGGGEGAGGEEEGVEGGD